MTRLLPLFPVSSNIMVLVSFACGYEKERNVSYAAWSSGWVVCYLSLENVYDVGNIIKFMSRILLRVLFVWWWFFFRYIASALNLPLVNMEERKEFLLGFRSTLLNRLKMENIQIICIQPVVKSKFLR